MSAINGQESVFEAISELMEVTGIIKTDICWIKKGINEIKERQNRCNACANSEYILRQANTNKDDIKKLQDERNRIIGISVGISIIISSLVGAIELGIIKL